MYVVINITSTALDLCIVVMLAILHSGCWCRIWSSPWRRQFVLKNLHRVTTERLLSKNSWSRRLKFVKSPKSVAMSIFNPVAGLKKVCLLDCSLVGPIVGLKIGQAGQATEKAQVWRMRLWQTCQGDWGYDPGMVSCRPSSRERITKKHTMMDTWNRLYTFKHNQKGSIYGILQRPWCVEDLGEEFFCAQMHWFLGASESVTRCECEANERSWDHGKFRGHGGWQVDPFKEAPRIGWKTIHSWAVVSVWTRTGLAVIGFAWG